MSKIGLTDYIAYNQTDAAQSLLKKYGLKAASNYPQLIAGLNYIIKYGKEEGLTEVANIHPDKNLILTLFSEEKKSGTDGTMEEKTHSICPCMAADGSGCGGSCGCKKCKHKREKVSNYQGGYVDDWNLVTQDDLDAAVSKVMAAKSQTQAMPAIQQPSLDNAAHNNNTTLLLGGALLLTLAVVLTKH